MLKLTPELKSWLIKNADCKEDTSDEDFRAAAAKALVEGKLSMEKYTELTTSKGEQKVDALTKQLQENNESIKALIGLMTPKEETADEKAAKEAAEAEAKAKAEAEVKTKAEKESKTPAKHYTGVKKLVMDAIPDEDEKKDYEIRVKEASDSYSSTKSALSYPTHTKTGNAHPLAGQLVRNDEGRLLESNSDQEQAAIGAIWKFNISAHLKRSRELAFRSLNQHDRELVCWAMDKLKWGGVINGIEVKNRPLTPSEQKALIDDSTSGGLEAAPIAFDDMVIQAPLLNGELYPLVNQVALDRGRRVEGVSTGTVTSSWGGVDDTAISLFNTASFVSAFDTTIYRWEGAVRIGLDFLSDTPIDFGNHLSAQYGERLLEDLDDVIAAGNGTTQPEGVINKSGTTSVAFGGATSIGNYESLRFGVSKAEHKGPVASSAVFCGTETSYQRARALPVGASDARRLFGMNYDSYNLMERPYKINESLSNQQIFYAILKRYRMYVRAGMSIRTSTEGDTLIRANEMLMVVMARYGGQLERGACAAITTTAPS